MYFMWNKNAHEEFKCTLQIEGWRYKVPQKASVDYSVLSRQNVWDSLHWDYGEERCLVDDVAKVYRDL